MPQIEYLEPPDPKTEPELFKDWCMQMHLRLLGLGSGTKGDLDEENIPTLSASGAVTLHMADDTIHFTVGSISITISQISDFGSYEPADDDIQLTITAYNNHAADSTIHFTEVKGEFSIPLLDSHVLTMGADDHPLHLLLAGRSGGQTISDNVTITPSTGVALLLTKVLGEPSLKGDNYLILDSAGTGYSYISLNHYNSDDVWLANGGGDVYSKGDLIVEANVTFTPATGTALLINKVTGSPSIEGDSYLVLDSGGLGTTYVSLNQYNTDDVHIANGGGVTRVRGNLTIGKGTAGVDYVITVDGETNDLTMTYMEDEDRLDISSDIKVKTYERHIDIEVGHASGGSTAPSEVQIGTASGLTYNADAEQSKIAFEIPHDWDGVSDFSLDVKWCPLTAIADTETVKWDITYRVKAENVGATVDGGTATIATVTYTQSGVGTVNEYLKHTITLAYNDADNPLVKGSKCFIQFDRDMTGDTFGGDATALEWDVRLNSTAIPKN